MRVSITNDIHLADIVVFAHLEAVNNARRYMEHAEHDHHGGGKVLAMALFAIEQKLGQWIVRAILEIQAIAIVSLQVHLDRPCPVIRIRQSASYLMRQILNSRVEPYIVVLFSG